MIGASRLVPENLPAFSCETLAPIECPDPPSRRTKNRNKLFMSNTDWMIQDTHNKVQSILAAVNDIESGDTSQVESMVSELQEKVEGIDRSLREVRSTLSSLSEQVENLVRLLEEG